MIRRVSIIYSSAAFKDMTRAFFYSLAPNHREDFIKKFSSRVIKGDIFLTDSGISAFYILLRSLAHLSGKKDVIIPAYTAGSLVTAIRKAGLKVVLCDTSKDDFNIDMDKAACLVTKDTLAVIAVHMFGIPVKDLDKASGCLKGRVFIVEDCAQSLGTNIGNRSVGNFSDASFFSFGRGKNLSLSGGGLVVTKDVAISESIKQESARLVSGGHFSDFLNVLSSMLTAAASDPFIYRVFHNVIDVFKSVSPSSDFPVYGMGHFQNILGSDLICRVENMASKRDFNVRYIMDKLKSPRGVVFPNPGNEDRVAFSRFPIIFKEVAKRRYCQRLMTERGIDNSRMYLRPLHHMFDLGYEHSEFPNASALAEGLITLPAHPGLTRKDLDRMVSVLRKVCE